MSSILPYLTQFQSGASLQKIRDSEKEWHLGGSFLAAIPTQVVLVSAVVSQINLCLKLKGYRPLSGRALFVIYSSPVGSALLYHILPSGHPTKKIFRIFTYNTGAFCQRAYWISIIALGIMKEYQYVVPPILGCTFGLFLDNPRYNNEYRKTLKIFYLFFSSLCEVLFSKTWIARMLGSVSMLDLFDNHLSSYLYGDFTEKNLKNGKDNSLKAFKTIPLHMLGVDPKHLKEKGAIRKNPPTYSSFVKTIDRMYSIFNDTTWEDHIELIHLLLTQDDQWKDAHFIKEGVIKSWNADPSSPTSTLNGIAFMKEGMEIFLYRVKRKSAKLQDAEFKACSPSLTVRKTFSSDISLSNADSYKDLEYLLNKICNYIAENPESPKSTYAMMMLGVCGGNYCLSRIVELLPQVYKELFKEEFTAEEVLFELLKEKQASFLKDIEGADFPKKFPPIVQEILGTETPHYHHAFLKMYGEPIGMDASDSEGDKASSSNILRPLLFCTIKSINQRFWKTYYTPKALIDVVQNNPRLTFNQLNEWFEKKNCLNPSKYSDLSNAKISKKSAMYFLVQSGVLGFKSPRLHQSKTQRH